MRTTTATVETLTAEVRVLMVGSRQITQSVARQLDYCPWQHLEPMGRVRLGDVHRAGRDIRADIVGRDRRTGALCRCTAWDPAVRVLNDDGSPVDVDPDAWPVVQTLPLIVLAGLR